MTTKTAPTKRAHGTENQTPSRAKSTHGAALNAKSSDTNATTTTPNEDAPEEFFSGSPEPHGNHK